MAVTPADIKAYAPEFAGAADALVQRFIDDAPFHIGETEFGDAYDYATRLWVCHALAIGDAGTDSFGADIKEQRVGKVAKSYFATATFADGLSKTAHGQLLLKLIRARLGPAAMAV